MKQKPEIFYPTQELKETLTEYSTKYNYTKSEIIRTALIEYFKNRGEI